MASCPEGSKHRGASTESRDTLLSQLQPLLTVIILFFQLIISVFQNCNNLKSLLQLHLHIDHIVYHKASILSYNGQHAHVVQNESDEHSAYA